MFKKRTLAAAGISSKHKFAKKNHLDYTWLTFKDLVYRYENEHYLPKFEIKVSSSYTYNTANVIEKILPTIVRENILKNKVRYMNMRQRDYINYNCKTTLVNRAAVKLCNLNAIQKLFTDDVKYVADLCNAPGGFVDVARRLNRDIVMYGITNSNIDYYKFIYENTYKLKYNYIVGDICYKEVRNMFRTLCDNNTIDLVLADGSVMLSDNDRDYNYQEYHNKKLILAQVIMMLSIIADNGKFVLKLFNIYTLFNYDLIYCLSMMFDEIIITKPISSRCANSEKYIMCFNYNEIIGHKLRYELLKVESSLYNNVDVTRFLNINDDKFKTWYHNAVDRISYKQNYSLGLYMSDSIFMQNEYDCSKWFEDVTMI